MGGGNQGLCREPCRDIAYRKPATGIIVAITNLSEQLGSQRYTSATWRVALGTNALTHESEGPYAQLTNKEFLYK